VCEVTDILYLHQVHEAFGFIHELTNERVDRDLKTNCYCFKYLFDWILQWETCYAYSEFWLCIGVSRLGEQKDMFTLPFLGPSPSLKTVAEHIGVSRYRMCKRIRCCTCLMVRV